MFLHSIYLELSLTSVIFKFRETHFYDISRLRFYLIYLNLFGYLFMSRASNVKNSFF